MGNFAKLLVSLSILGIVQAQEKQTVCRALALAGGGSIGAYEAGVVYGLIHAEDPTNFEWDVVSGVSAGALNVGGISLWEKEKTLEMADWLLQVWANLTTNSIYNEWPEGLIKGIFDEYGAFDDTPLLNLVKGFFDQLGGVKRKLVVSSVEVNTGTYVTFDESTPQEDMPLAVVSSASIPFVFPHRQYKDYILMDGGTVWNTNIVTAAEKCRQLVDDDSQIIMDIVLTGDHEIHEEMDTGNAINNFLRYYGIHTYYKHFNDVLEFKRSRPDIQYRYLVMPSGKVASGLRMILFTQDVIQPMVELGKLDGANAVKMGSGAIFNLMDEYVSQTNEYQKKFSFKQFVSQVLNQ